MVRRVFARIYEVVRRIPKGKVATYGQIAEMVNRNWELGIGKKIDARIVGWVLH